MEFFNDINRAIENAGNTAKQKTKDLTDVARMNNAIKSEERKLEEIYRRIGEIYVKKYYAETENLFRELVSQARETEQNIESYTTRVQKIKKVDTCPNCGKEIPLNAAFCMHCGAQLNVQVQEQQTVETDTCKVCGYPMENGMMFCTNCGTPVEMADNEKEERNGAQATSQQIPMPTNTAITETPKQDHNITATTAEPPRQNTEKRKRFCTKCGNELEEGERFCIKCGAAADSE